MPVAVGFSPPGRSSWVAAYSPTVLQSQVSVISLWRPTASGITVSSRGAPPDEILSPDLCQHWHTLTVP
eukprot:4870829-Lingulodinium_polyedra.AAC.1